MTLKNAQKMKQLFHLTPLFNMESIIKNGLKSRNLLNNNQEAFIDIAAPEILDKRNWQRLGDYIPFHFHPYSAFDFAVKNSHRDIKFVYITIKRDFARYARFKVIPSHPLSNSGQPLEFFDYDEGFSTIDWEAVATPGNSDPYVKSAKMAECLADRTIPATLFQNVYVPDLETKEYIEQLFQNNGIVEQPPYVNVWPELFFLNEQ